MPPFQLKRVHMLIVGLGLAAEACTPTTSRHPIVIATRLDSAAAVDVASQAWSNFRGEAGLVRRPMRVGEFRATDSSYVVSLFPQNPQTRGGGVIVEVFSSDSAIIRQILD